jgi:hypothetical protein
MDATSAPSESRRLAPQAMPSSITTSGKMTSGGKGEDGGGGHEDEGRGGGDAGEAKKEVRVRARGEKPRTR